MPERKINLEEILKLHCNVADYNKDSILEAMKDVCKQALELAAENIEIVYYNKEGKILSPNQLIEYDDYGKSRIDKQTILNTINQVL